MAQLITLLDRCVFEKPLRGSAFGKPRDYLQEATLSAAMLDTAIYSGQEDLLARTLKERDRLDSKVYMDLAGHAFENKYFDIFLIMYGCAADWTSVTRLITQGRLLMGPELQASARISMSHKITFGSQLARGEKVHVGQGRAKIDPHHSVMAHEESRFRLEEQMQELFEAIMA